MKKGELPNLKYLASRGNYGGLLSTFPPITPPAWTSLMTGKNPGKHGIFDFFDTKNFNMRIANSTWVRSDTIWDILSRHNKTTVAINIPLTYPPKKIQGMMVTGIMTPSHLSEFTYPRCLKHQILKKGYIINIEREDLEKLYKENKQELIHKIFHVLEKRKKIAEYLMNLVNWDLFIVVFFYLDYIQHNFWGYMDPKHPLYYSEDAGLYRNVILDTYRKLDNIIGKLLQYVDKETSVLVVSDHGMKCAQKYFHINDWLTQNGYLYLKNRNFIQRTFVKTGINQEVIYRLLKPLVKHSDKVRNLGRKIVASPEAKIFDIDFSKTQLFSASHSWTIRVNVKKREPQKLVENEDDYHSLIKKIEKKLYGIVDPETKSSAVKRIYKKHQIYSGPFLGNAPDLYVEMKDGYVMHPRFRGRVFEPWKPDYRSGEHDKRGIFIITSPKVKRLGKVRDHSLYDIVPTVLEMLNISIIMDFDGKPIKGTNKQNF